MPAAQCESERRGGSAPAEGDATAAAGWVADAKADLGNSWRELADSLHRHEAALPSGFALPEPLVPSIGTSDGRLSVRIPVRSGADPTRILTDVVTRLGGADASGTGQAASVRDGSVRLKVAECGAARVFHLEPETDGEGAQGDGVVVQLNFPRTGRGQALVEFLKRGPLTQQELAAAAAAMRAANTIEGPNADLQREQRPMEDLLEAAFQDMARMFPGSVEVFGHFGGFGGQPEGFGFDARTSGDMGEGQIELPRRVSPRRQAADAQSADSKPKYDYGSPEANAAAEKLLGMGAAVHPPGNADVTDWGVLAGYEPQKRVIEEMLLQPLQHPEIFDSVAQGTRAHPASNRPRAVLFEGPPGTGKTTSARVIATQAASPLIYVPLEAVASKWYGESEKNLSEVFKAANDMDGAIVFLDEIDSLATARGGDMHEATRKLLGVLLREMDGFDAGKRSIVIGATNRRTDLDPALLSRFDTSILFPLPDEAGRTAIVRSYAKQLGPAEAAEVARSTGGLSGRDLRDIACRTERAWANKIIRDEAQHGDLPDLPSYLAAARQQQEQRASDGASRGSRGVYGSLPPPARSLDLA